MEIIKQVKLGKKIIFYIKRYNGYYTSDILYTQSVQNFNVKISGACKGPMKKNKERRSFEIYSFFLILEEIAKDTDTKFSFFQLFILTNEIVAAVQLSNCNYQIR